ncbi:DUF3488 domain-containing protein [Piscinibacter sp. Jin2]|uniref:DUF3488 domain-containing protein n=1 Tax=Aquariibacter lacus TaxID=2801332 RepID=A0A9X1BRD6_9BURK|nr:DUF3488 domain-containing protein [Piscinibacter lacus]
MVSRWLPSRRAAAPREVRDTLFLLAVLGFTVAPHLPGQPLWTGGLVLAVLLWRAQLALRGAALPGRGLLLGLLLLALGLSLWTHGSLVGRAAGHTLLVVLVALKTLELRARRDALVVFFLGFFLVLAQFLGSQSPGTALAAALSVWGLLTALVLASLPAGKPPLREAAGLAGRLLLLALPPMLLLFALLPRPQPFWPGSGSARTGLSDSLAWGDVGQLALDPQPVLRLRLAPGQTLPPEARYFRGPVLGQFDGSRWTVLQASFPEALRPALNLRLSGQALDYELHVEATRLPVLPLPEASDGVFTRAPELAEARREDDLHWSLAEPLRRRASLQARLWTQFQHGPVELVVGLQDFLELPPGHNPRLLDLAARMRREPRWQQADARSLAAGLMQQLREGGYVYTLSPGAMGDPRSAIDRFWFERKAGFCEHYAAAFVVLMRAFDVPARLVTGYQGADWDAAEGVWIVRQRHAHAWAEIWQPGEGWLRIDPTQAVAPARLQQGPPPAEPAAWLRWLPGDMGARWQQGWQAFELGWHEQVLQAGPPGFGARLPSLMGAGLLLGGLGLAAWRWGRPRRAEAWTACWTRLRREAGRVLGPGPQPASPRALAAALRAQHGAKADEAVAALEALERWRWRPQEAGAGQAPALQALARRLRTALRALPPPAS